MTELAPRDVIKVPGLLSLVRVPLGALFFPAVSKPRAAIAVLVASAATDVADGWYARRYHQETPTGRMLDPVTDKLFVALVVLAMIRAGALSLSEALLLNTREFCEAALLLYWSPERRARARPARAANRLGKIATTMQFATVCAILLNMPRRKWWTFATAATGALAGISYAAREWRDELRERRQRANPKASPA